jgi:hypothetical protein
MVKGMKPPSLNGRQHHLIAKALAYAVNVVTRSPKSIRAFREHADMKGVVEQLLASDVELAAYQRTALHHIALLRR